MSGSKRCGLWAYQMGGGIDRASTASGAGSTVFGQQPLRSALPAEEMTGLRGHSERVWWQCDAARVVGLRPVPRACGGTGRRMVRRQMLWETIVTKQTVKNATGQSKKARLESLLNRPRGATIGQLQKALGWQPHTIRAAISQLRKSGAAVTLDRTGRTPIYRITVVT